MINLKSMSKWLFSIYTFGVIGICLSCKNEKTKVESVIYPELPVVIVDQKDTLLQNDYVSDIQAVKNVEIRGRVQGFL
ncbi:MAG: efflux transporter periplasmic adaptor subunit, partial [Sphingobacteriia bacterium]